jgi:UDP-GlcNAc3NAcA epimerase
MARRKILTVVGARPQFIKASALSRVLREHIEMREVLVHTGQHHDPEMSEFFFRELDLQPPTYDLGVAGLSHGAMTGRMLERLEQVCETEQPHVVLVYGDTNSTLAGALCAAKLRIPVAHVEAGLRSFNRRMPEEVNRVLSDHLSDLLFCPTSTAVRNLAAEGITRGVYAVGDVMYDVAKRAGGAAETHSRVLEQIGLEPRRYSVATVHRAENTDDQSAFEAIMRYLIAESAAMPIVFPAHPRVRERVGSWKGKGNLRIIEPLGYLDMVRLVSQANTVYTDSGGLQKEAYFHRVPCVTLRNETEWTETIDNGWNRLWRTSEYRPRLEIREYGDGHAGERIVGVMGEYLSET